jgi:hypothetical protein
MVMKAKICARSPQGTIVRVRSLSTSILIGLLRKAAALMLVVGALLTGGPASSTPIQFGSNYYEYVSADEISWDAANAASAGSVFGGVTGHLATVTSAAEDAFLFSLGRGLINAQP